MRSAKLAVTSHVKAIETTVKQANCGGTSELDDLFVSTSKCILNPSFQLP